MQKKLTLSLCLKKSLVDLSLFKGKERILAKVNFFLDHFLKPNLSSRTQYSIFLILRIRKTLKKPKTFY